MTTTMQAVLASLSFEESRAVYNALAQWADNERNGLEEGAGDEMTPSEVKAVPLVESVVERLEAVLHASVEPPPAAPVDPAKLTPGTYVLKQDVINPKPERRRTSSWTSFETILAGARFSLSEHPIGKDEGDVVLCLKLHTENGEAYPKDAAFRAVIKHLERVTETPSDYLKRDGSSLRSPRILDQLVSDGTITMDQFHAANAAHLATLK
jgi:hypothetical protein